MWQQMSELSFLSSLLLRMLFLHLKHCYLEKLSKGSFMNCSEKVPRSGRGGEGGSFIYLFNFLAVLSLPCCAVCGLSLVAASGATL